MIPDINLKDFDYILPKEKIALKPLTDRSKSKLLFINVPNESIEHRIFENIVDIIPNDSYMFVNSTKVIAARIPVKKQSGGKAEIFLVEPIKPSSDPQVTLASKNGAIWFALIGGRKIEKGDYLFLDHECEIKDLKFFIESKDGNQANVEITWRDEAFTMSHVLDLIGKIPLPPYIKREVEENDKDTYQTVYANADGSVAAPTAGLHFTKEIMSSLEAKGVKINELVLHVGPGTFKPIDAENIAAHDMHSERIILEKNSLLMLRDALDNNKNIVAVGTTSLRTLESVYWLGERLIREPNTVLNSDENFFEQWTPYDESRGEEVSPIDSIKATLEYFEKNNIEELSGRTKLFIAPGYKVKTANILTTNFHMPESTLILLVAAFIGKDLWRRAYDLALESDYRFLSYGDTSVLIRNKK
jgi:S-adenosylmethionine:tRNA ribosyltransferase-isomerase